MAITPSAPSPTRAARSTSGSDSSRDLEQRAVGQHQLHRLRSARRCCGSGSRCRGSRSRPRPTTSACRCRRGSRAPARSPRSLSFSAPQADPGLDLDQAGVRGPRRAPGRGRAEVEHHPAGAGDVGEGVPVADGAHRSAPPSPRARRPRPARRGSPGSRSGRAGSAGRPPSCATPWPSQGAYGRIVRANGDRGPRTDPTVRPEQPKGRLMRALVWTAKQRPVTWFLVNVGNQIDPVLMRRSGGRLKSTISAPTVLLTHTGAKSGTRRTTPLAYFTDGEDVVLIASRGGAPQQPRLVPQRPRQPRGRALERRWRRHLPRPRGRGHRARAPLEAGDGLLPGLRALPGARAEPAHPGRRLRARSPADRRGTLIYPAPAPRRGGRAVECGGLESR